MKNIEEIKKKIRERSKEHYWHTTSDCEICKVSTETCHRILNGRYQHVCEACDEKIMVDKILNKTSAEKNFFYAFIHAAICVSWVPLTWAISEDVIIYFLGAIKYVWQFQWGFAATGIIFNLYHFVMRLYKAGVRFPPS